MMKKLLLSFSFFAIVGTSVSYGQSSCTPDFSCLAGATEGICPDSATGLPSATIGLAYSTTVSVKIPASYTYMSTTYNLTHLGITEVEVDTNSSGTYVPLSSLGLTYLGNGANSPSGTSGPTGVTVTEYTYWDAPGGGCVVVSGTPNKTGTFPIKIKSYVRAIIFTGIWLPAPDNTDYKLVVMPPAGVGDLSSSKFEMAQNTPNPFSSKTNIDFTSLNASNVEFKVYNLLGTVVYKSNVKAEKGVNTINLDASTFAPGVYMYSIKNGDKTITKRMIVAGK